MPEGRPDIPRSLERDVLVEAGHRCAIPTCRSVPVELAHIVPWSKVHVHTFSNLIALCPTCHSRYDTGQIDRLSMLRYKNNLGILTSRYGELERRVLERLGGAAPQAVIQLPAGGFGILLMYLLDDGLLEELALPLPQGINSFGTESVKTYTLTQKGRDFANRWMNAEEL